LSSSYGTNSAPAQRAGRAAQRAPHGGLARPGTLTATVTAGLAAAVFGLGGAAVTFAAGKSMLRNMVGDVLGAKTVGAAGGFINLAIDEAYKTLQSRAVVAVVVALIVGVLAFAARGGNTGIRIGLTAGLLVGAGLWLLNVKDSGVPGMIRGIDGVALACCLAGIVLAWLPANGRFASDSKAMSRN